ncbi:MAG TPA: 50S ribosomal protein L6 [archaeon]|nr:50S ribosomal protein L6 [archaeon]
MAGKLVESVAVPDGITAEVEGRSVRLSAGGKENRRNFKSGFIALKKNGNNIEVWTESHKKNAKAECISVASHIRNMASGLQKDFEYRLEVVFSHFPMNVAVKGNVVEINNLAGAKFARKAKIAEGTKVEVKGKDIIVRGHNKEKAGQTAANIEQATKISGKDVRIFQDGVYITAKPAKE